MINQTEVRQEAYSRKATGGFTILAKQQSSHLYLSCLTSDHAQKMRGGNK